MKKRVFLIHGWDGGPENNWFPWLKANLESKGFEVTSLAMPQPETPKQKVWVNFLLKVLPDPDESTYLVGHSMGCQAIQRYLETLPEGKNVGGALLVAGWIDYPKWEGRTEEESEIVNDWFNNKKNYNLMRKHCKKFVAIFSTDDEFILENNWKQAEEQLDAEVIMVENKGHFADYDEVKDLPEALDAILKISNEKKVGN